MDLPHLAKDFTKIDYTVESQICQTTLSTNNIFTSKKADINTGT